MTVARTKKLTDSTYSPTNPATESDIRNQVDGAIDEVYVNLNAGKSEDSATVHNTGNETIAGVKTFSSSPIVPTPVNATDVANKSYVDSTILTNVLELNNATPYTPTTQYNPATKKYVDDTTTGVVLGQVPDGSITDAKLSNTAGQIKDTLNSHLADYVRQPGYGLTTGGTLAYLLTLSPVPTSYADGMGISAKINTTNTGTTTINVNSLGVKTIKNPDGTDLIAGDLVAGGIYSLKYNSTTTNFILVGKGGGPNKAGSNTVFTVSTADQAITKGYYPGNSIDGKVKGEAQLLAGNLPIGVTIGGIAGTGVNAKRYASGTVSSAASASGTFYAYANTARTNMVPVVVTGLTFQPSIIYLTRTVLGDFADDIRYTAVPFNNYAGNKQITSYNSSFGDRMFNLSGSAAVSSSGFTLPADKVNIAYTWYAWE